MATSPMTPTPVSAVDQGLDAAWEEACNAFRVATGISLKTQATPSADDIRAKFDAKKTKDADDHRKIDKAKDVFTKTVTVIDRVGGIAAAGASMVFGSPATIAAGALSFFIDAGLQYRNVFTNIDDLLSQIVVVLERFQIYRDNQNSLPPQMIRVANKLLVAVVNICGICYKNLKKNRVVTFLNIALFSDDKGVRAQLGRLKALESEESQMKGTLNLVAAETTKRNIATGFKETREGVEKLSGGMQRVEAQIKDQQDLEELKERLSIPKQSNHIDEYHRYLDRLTDEACGWLYSDEAYQSWADCKDVKNSILVLAGDEGCGKSYTATAIVADLIKRYPQKEQTAERVSVAYYYLTKGDKTGQAPSLHQVLRWLVWQVAQNDIFYRKDIITICKRVQDLGGTQGIWQQLFLDCFEEDATFFLVIDGIHELENEEQELLVELVKTLVAKPKVALRLNVLLAARSPFVKSLRAKLPASTSMLNLAEKTLPDIRRHIRAEAEKMTIFQKKTDKVQELKEAVCTGLADAVGGSFVYADYLLAEISSKYDPQEVMDIVARAKESGKLSDSITDVIKKCNQTLSAKELQDLNTLLLWVMYGGWGFDLSELEAVLVVRRGEPSLRPLYNRISEQYSAFFTIDPDEDLPYACVALKSDSIAEYFQQISAEQTSATSTSTTALSKGEIRIVQNFIIKMCEQDIYDRLGLGGFFDLKLSESDTTIAVDCENAHALMTIDCLRVLIGDVEGDATGLRAYVVVCMIDHLKQLDLDGVDPRYKAEIGPLLTRLLTNGDAIDKALQVYGIGKWSFDDEIPKEMVRLLRSSAVMKKITAAGGDDKDWVASVLASPSPPIAIFESIVNHMLKRWMSAMYIEENGEAFVWALGFYNKVQHSKDPQSHARITKCPSLEEVPASVIREVFEWAKTQCEYDYACSESLRNLGVTFRICNHLDEAVVQLHEALAASPDDLRVLCNISKAFAFRSKDKGTNEYEKAIGYAKRIIAAAAEGKDIFEPDDAKDVLYEFQLLAAEWSRKTHAYEDATKIYDSILAKDRRDYYVMLQVVLMLCDQERYADVVTFVTELETQADETTQQTRLSYFLHNYAWEEDTMYQMVSAFKRSDALPLVKQQYQKAVADATKAKDDHTEESLWTFGTLQGNLARILHHHAADASEADRAIALWEELLFMDGSRDALGGAKFRSGKSLSTIYMKRAIEAGRDTPDASEMIGKIEALGLGTTDDDELYGLSKVMVRSLLGRYHAAVGDHAQAKACLKPNVEVGLKLLSDDDDENDFQGFRKLGDALMDYGDDVNALAAWTMIGPNQGLEQFEQPPSPDEEERPVEGVNGNSMPVASDDPPRSNDSTKPNGAGPLSDSTAPSVATADATVITPTTTDDGPAVRPILHRSSTSQLEKKLSGPLTYFCDGGCDKIWSFIDDVQVCRECIDVQFCSPCLEKLRAGQLTRYICHSEHRFFHLPAWDPSSIERVKNGRVLVGEDEVEVGEWLKRVGEAWGVEVVEKASKKEEDGEGQGQEENKDLATEANGKGEGE